MHGTHTRQWPTNLLKQFTFAFRMPCTKTETHAAPNTHTHTHAHTHKQPFARKQTLHTHTCTLTHARERQQLARAKVSANKKFEHNRTAANSIELQHVGSEQHRWRCARTHTGATLLLLLLCRTQSNRHTHAHPCMSAMRFEPILAASFVANFCTSIADDAVLFTRRRSHCFFSALLCCAALVCCSAVGSYSYSANAATTCRCDGVRVLLLDQTRSILRIFGTR